MISRSLMKDSFDPGQRLDLFETYKPHLSKEQVTEFQENLISDQAEKIKEQEEAISDKEELCIKLRSEADSVKESMDTVLDYARRVGMIRFIRNPIKKYKAYKDLLLTINKVK